MSFLDTLKTYVLTVFATVKSHWILVTSISVASFVGSVLFCTLVIAYLPFDYFLLDRHEPRIKHPVLRIALKCLKNLIAAVLVVVGVLQLFLPGQGILTLLIGLIISDIPGKRKLERRIIRSPAILAAANGIRSRFKRPLFIIDEPRE